MEISNNLFYALLLCYYTFILTLMVTFFRWDFLKKKIVSEYKAIILYFLLFFVFIVFIPFLLIIFILKTPFQFLQLIGIRIPLYFLQIVAGSIPLTIISMLISKNSPDVLKFYPFAKEILTNNKKFIPYSIYYLFFYFFSWEFLFRGILLIGFINLFGNEIAVLLIAFSLQLIIAMLMHLGHPKTEIWGSVIGGILFGIAAFISQSIIIPFIFHGLVGIGTDYYILVQSQKNKN